MVSKRQAVFACYCATETLDVFVLTNKSRQISSHPTKEGFGLDIYNDTSPFTQAECIAAALQCCDEATVSLFVSPSTSAKVLSLVATSFPEVAVQPLTSPITTLDSIYVGVVRKICPKLWGEFFFEIRLGSTVLAMGGSYTINAYSGVGINVLSPVLMEPGYSLPSFLQIMICVMGKDVDTYVFEVLTLLRRWGFSTMAVKAHTSPIKHCLQEQIPFCAFLGPSDMSRRVLTLKRIQDRVQCIFNIDAEQLELQAFINNYLTERL